MLLEEEAFSMKQQFKSLQKQSSCLEKKSMKSNYEMLEYQNLIQTIHSLHLGLTNSVVYIFSLQYITLIYSISLLYQKHLILITFFIVIAQSYAMDNNPLSNVVFKSSHPQKHQFIFNQSNVPKLFITPLFSNWSKACERTRSNLVKKNYLQQ